MAGLWTLLWAVSCLCGFFSSYHFAANSGSVITLFCDRDLLLAGRHTHSVKYFALVLSNKMDVFCAWEIDAVNLKGFDLLQGVLSRERESEREREREREREWIHHVAPPPPPLPAQAIIGRLLLRGLTNCFGFVANSSLESKLDCCGRHTHNNNSSNPITVCLSTFSGLYNNNNNNNNNNTHPAYILPACSTTELGF